MRKLLPTCFVFLSAVVSAQPHPEFILTSNTLTALAAKATADDPTWKVLKSACDAYRSGKVVPPDTTPTDRPDIPTSNNYQGSDYLQFAQDYGECYQVEKKLGDTALTAKYGEKLVAIANALTDPAHQSSHNDPNGSFQTEDDGYSIRNYPMALLYAYDWGYELFSSAQRTAIVNELNSFIDTWDRGWAYPVVSGGAITGSVLWYGPKGSGTACKVNGGRGTGAACTVTRNASGFVTAVHITSGGSNYTGTGQDSPYFTIGGKSTIPYGGGYLPFNPGTFDSNYYAPYYAVKVLTALITADNNPRAAEFWNDWNTRIHGKLVQPWYAAYRVGGGWPEGFQNYGEQATRLMSLPTIAVNDIKGIDLIHAPGTPYMFPLDSVDYIIYATWPSLDYVYDEGHSYNWNGPGSVEPGYAQAPFYKYLYGFAKRWDYGKTMQFHKFADDVIAATTAKWGKDYGFADDAANDFLWWTPSDNNGDYRTLPLSYLAQGATQGAGHVFSRSDWSTSALWLGYNGGAYLDDGGQSEEKFGKGGLELVRGSKPLLVNPMNWIMREGSKGESNAYGDYGGNPNKERAYYNTFQVFQVPTSGWNTPQDTNQVQGTPPVLPGMTPGSFYDAGQNSTAAQRTAVTAFEDGGGYVIATSRYLEGQFRDWDNSVNGHCPVAGWTRQVVYLRPTNQVVVYDRTSTCHYSAASVIDQQIAFHTPARPALEAQSPVVAGTTRFDVTYGGTFTGSVISILPANAAVTSRDLDGGSTVWRITVRPPACTSSGCSADPGASLRWLTVLDANTSSAAVANASNLSAKGMTGALLKGASSNSVVLFNAGVAGTTVSGAISYSIPTGVATSHVLSELPASTRYNISSTGGTLTIAPSSGGGFVTTANGVLSFQSDASGNVSGAATRSSVSASHSGASSPTATGSQ
jgi:hypothetical protein